MSAAPLFDVSVHRFGREEHVLRLDGGEQKPSDEPFPYRRAQPEGEEAVETAHELAVVLGLLLNRPGSSAESFLRSELAAEVKVRTYLVLKRLGDAAPKGAWSARLLSEHAPTFGDIPELIEKVPLALHSQSVINLIRRLRQWERYPGEWTGGGSTGRPLYRTSAPPGSLPKILKRYAHPDKDRRALLARIGRALANVRPVLRLAAPLVLARLEEIEARALEMPRGQRNKRRAELARAAGFKGSSVVRDINDAQVLAAFRLELRRARLRASLRQG